MSRDRDDPDPHGDPLGEESSGATAALSDSREEEPAAPAPGPAAAAPPPAPPGEPDTRAATGAAGAGPRTEHGTDGAGRPAADEPVTESSAAIARLPEPSESAEAPVPDLPPPPDYGSSESDPALGPSSARARAAAAPLVRPRTDRPHRADSDEEVEPVAEGEGFPEPPPLAVVDAEDERGPAARVEPGSEHDILFGELARLQRFVSEEQLAEAIRISERLRAEGRPKKLGKIMVKLGYLTATQAKYLLRLQRTPDPIEGYKLLERRGQGGMGVVYRAVQKSLKREVAIKVLSPKWAQHGRFLQRFFREAKLAGELKHPNVVSAIDIGESAGLHYYAMEYVDGWSVAEILKEDGAFDEGEALDIVLQIAKALQHAAEHHVVHRDVKPENILVTPDGLAKLADLGLSKQMTSDCSLTTEGKTLGTPFYVSPELARGARDVDVRSDIYSLGATLYHMLVGEPPFTGDNPAAIMARHIAEEAVPVKRRRRDVTATTSKMVERMMAKDPARRYQTADELIRDIIAIRKGKNPFAGGRDAPDAAPARATASVASPRTGTPVAARRRVITSPGERPAYTPYSRGAVAAAVGALAVAAVAFALLARNYAQKRDSENRARAAAGGTATAAEGRGTGGGGDGGGAPSVAAEREWIAKARLAKARQDVELRLGQERYDEAVAAVAGLEEELAGTLSASAARELVKEVRHETDRALEKALGLARRELGVGRPDFALEILKSAPTRASPALVEERARVKAEAEKAVRGQ